MPATFQLKLNYITAAESPDATPTPTGSALPLRRVLVIAAVSGFLALSWEILWARLYNYVSASRATAFGAMLGSYLLGLAAGSLLSMRWQRAELRLSVGSLVRLLVGANVAAFLVIPAASWMVVRLPGHVYLAGGIDLASWMWTLLLVLAASALRPIRGFLLVIGAWLPPGGPG